MQRPFAAGGADGDGVDDGDGKTVGRARQEQVGRFAVAVEAVLAMKVGDEATDGACREMLIADAEVTAREVIKHAGRLDVLGDEELAWDMINRRGGEEQRASGGDAVVYQPTRAAPLAIAARGANERLETLARACRGPALDDYFGGAVWEHDSAHPRMTILFERSRIGLPSRVLHRVDPEGGVLMGAEASHVDA